MNALMKVDHRRRKRWWRGEDKGFQTPLTYVTSYIFTKHPVYPSISVSKHIYSVSSAMKRCIIHTDRTCCASDLQVLRYLDRMDPVSRPQNDQVTDEKMKDEALRPEEAGQKVSVPCMEDSSALTRTGGSVSPGVQSSPIRSSESPRHPPPYTPTRPSKLIRRAHLPGRFSRSNQVMMGTRDVEELMKLGAPLRSRAKRGRKRVSIQVIVYTCQLNESTVIGI
jgi:hypothetical protein